MFGWWAAYLSRVGRMCDPGQLAAAPALEMPTGWWFGSYLDWWNQQVTTLLLDHAQLGKSEAFAVLGPVNHFEDVSVLRFTGSRQVEGHRYLHRIIQIARNEIQRLILRVGFPDSTSGFSARTRNLTTFCLTTSGTQSMSFRHFRT